MININMIFKYITGYLKTYKQITLEKKGILFIGNVVITGICKHTYMKGTQFNSNINKITLLQILFSKYRVS